MDIIRIVKNPKKWVNTRVAYMLALCVEYKWNMQSYKNSFVDPDWICVISETKEYEGEICKNVPSDIKAWFLSPEHYEEYIELCKQY